MTTDENSKTQRQIAVQMAAAVPEQHRALIIAWSRGLLDIKASNLPALQKAKEALALTARSKVAWPIAKSIALEMKRHAWDERGLKGRLGIAGVAVGTLLFGGQSAGIAALGSAIGVPLWVVLGAGGTFAGFLIQELSGKSDQAPKTTYTVVEPERIDRK